MAGLASTHDVYDEELDQLLGGVRLDDPDSDDGGKEKSNGNIENSQVLLFEAVRSPTDKAPSGAGLAPVTEGSNGERRTGGDTCQRPAPASRNAPEKPKRAHHHSPEKKPEDAGNNHASSSQAVYADISHDKNRSAQPPPKGNETVTYSDISHVSSTQYADLDLARDGKKIPQKHAAVVYSEVK